MDSAADHLTADLERPRGSLPRRAWRWVWAIITSFGGSPEFALDLVVRRRATGAEVLRTPADLGDPQHLLDTVRDDLRTKTVEQFVREWRVVES